jgi:hypothetical protein
MKNSALSHILKDTFPDNFSPIYIWQSGQCPQNLFGQVFAVLHKRANFREEQQEKLKSIFNKLSWQRIFQLRRINRLSPALEKAFNNRCFSEKIMFGILALARKKKLCLPKLLKHKSNFCELADYTLNFLTIKHFFDWQNFVKIIRGCIRKDGRRFARLN